MVSFLSDDVSNAPTPVELRDAETNKLLAKYTVSLKENKRVNALFRFITGTQWGITSGNVKSVNLVTDTTKLIRRDGQMLNWSVAALPSAIVWGLAGVGDYQHGDIIFREGIGKTLIF